MSKRWLLLLGLTIAGCGSSPLTNQTDAASSGGQCRRDPSVGTGKPGSCGASRAFIDCEYPDGSGCSCMTDGTSCPGCGAGGTCPDKCAANEYAVSCGTIGPGDPSITYADAPAACRLELPTPAGIAYYCCPCL